MDVFLQQWPFMKQDAPHFPHTRFPSSHFLCCSTYHRVSLLWLLIQCCKMSCQILLEKILSDGLRHMTVGESTDKQAQHVCFFIRGAYVYMFVACKYMFMFVSDSVLFTCKSHQSRSASASQARVRGHARLFYYLPIYAVWKELMQ